jgi:hypothetical protein
MYVAIDETADFTESGKHRFGVVTLVSSSDKAWEAFTQRMDTILLEWKTTKSNDIRNSIRKKILNEITLRNEIKYYAYAYDISPDADYWAEWHKTQQAERIQIAIDNCLSEKSPKTLIEDLQLLKNQLSKYSVADYAKFILIFDLLAEWNKYKLFDYVYMNPNRDTWDFSIFIDTQSKSTKFERLVQSMLVLTTNERNHKYKSFFPVELGPDHPYIQKYAVKLPDNRQGTIETDGRKIYPRINVTSEQISPQIFLPDFIGSILHKSIFYQHNIENHKLLVKLTSARSLALNNKFVRSKNNYYHIRTFNKNLKSNEVSQIFKDHYKIING